MSKQRLASSACVLGLASTFAGCVEETEPCIDRPYDVRVEEVLPLPELTFPVDAPPTELGEGWEFEIRPLGVQLQDHQKVCHAVKALYDPPPSGVVPGAFSGGSIGGAETYRSAAQMEGATLEFRGCQVGLSAVLLTPRGADKVESARRLAEQGGQPVALSLCFLVDGGGVDPAMQDPASCEPLREELSVGYGMGCILRAVELTPRP